jgi:hypothetical protein
MAGLPMKMQKENWHKDWGVPIGGAAVAQLPVSLSPMARTLPSSDRKSEW